MTRSFPPDPADPSPPPGGPDGDRERIQVTSATAIAIQAAVGVVAGLIVFRAVEAVAGTPPTLPPTMPLLLAVTAMVVIVLARHTWRKVHRENAWVEASRGLRLLALGKAAVALGAVLGGLQLGILILLVPRLAVEVNGQRALVSGVGAAICVVLVVAGLALQRACRVPDDEADAPTPRR